MHPVRRWRNKNKMSRVQLCALVAQEKWGYDVPESTIQSIEGGVEPGIRLALAVTGATGIGLEEIAKAVIPVSKRK